MKTLSIRSCWLKSNWQVRFDFYASRKNHLIIAWIFLAAFDYLLSNPNDPLNVKAFEESSGIGVVVTPQQIKLAVEQVVKKNLSELLEKRYKYPLGPLLGIVWVLTWLWRQMTKRGFEFISAELRTELKWADGKLLKTEFDNHVGFC